MKPEANKSQADEMAAAAAGKVSKVYKVYDLNQRGDKPRHHEVITKFHGPHQPPETLAYPLYSAEDKGCPMPEDHAIKFLCDPAFKVIGPNGNRIMPIERPDLSKPAKLLEVDEVVTKYVNLSREYLYKLVKMTAGSENIKPNATAEELAEFMVKYRESLVRMSNTEIALRERMAEGNLDGEMPQSQLEEMFGGRKAA